MENKGNIILLNGTSSSGKTTLSKALQIRLTEVYYWFSFDSMFEKIRHKILYTDYQKTIRESLCMMDYEIKLYSDMGKNVIIDTVLEKNIFWDFWEILRGYPVLLVKVMCPISELQKREKERGDRRIGQAESQLETLYPQNKYDITINTHSFSLDECVDQIIKCLNKAKGEYAFKDIEKQYTDNI
jgi:chloramphenicol 3-O-phosphotransferase